MAIVPSTSDPVSIWRVFRSAWTLPLDDLNYETSSEALGVHAYRPYARWRQGVVPNIGVFIAKLMRALYEWRPFDWSRYRETRVLVAVGSVNQQRAVAPVVPLLEGANVVTFDRQATGDRYPEALAYLASVGFLPAALARAFCSEGYRRQGYARAFDDYWLTYGYYLASYRLLRRIDPALVLLVNDHSMRFRTLARAARDLDIETAYLPHASVTEGFPPLSFDLAFLDGVDAAEKYDRTADATSAGTAGSAALGTTAFLTGMPRADAARLEARLRTSIQTVGLCVNTLDPTEAVQRFVRDFTATAPGYALVVRPHPGDRRPWASLLGQPVSDAKTETPFAFLDRVDAIVTGPSNIALEAALVNVLPLYMDFAGADRDHYGFVRHGLCVPVEGAADAVAALDAYEPDPSQTVRAKAFCATLGTAFDGRSAELIASLIDEHLNGGIDMSRWRRVPSIAHVVTFELAPLPDEPRPDEPRPDVRSAPR